MCNLMKIHFCKRSLLYYLDRSTMKSTLNLLDLKMCKENRMSIYVDFKVLRSYMCFQTQRLRWINVKLKNFTSNINM